MDVQAAPPTYTPAGGVKPPAGNPPVLGQQVPGMSGGLPSLGGLSVTQNPMAQKLQSYGRGEDTMLVHMTPAEVNSLQGLALAHGGSLTINPHTGLPEAGWLGRLLPTILGAVGMAFGIPPIWMGAAGAVGGTIATGDLGKGLSMGLQAYGGASLGGAAGIGGKLGHVGQSLGLSGSSAAVMNPTTAVLDKAKDAAANKAMQQVAAKGLDVGSKGAQDILTNAGKQFTKPSGILGGFGAGAQAGLPGGMFGKVAPMLAAQGAMSGVAEASKGGYKGPTYKSEEPGLKYTPMAGLQRKVRFQTPEQMEASGGAEYQYFTPVNPEPMPLSQVQQQPEGFADGGAASAPPGFEELVASYAADNPGAITASMKYPVSAPAPAAEQKYNFRPTAPTPAAPTPGTGLGGIDLSGLNLGNLGNFDFSNLFIPATATASARADAGNNRLEDFSNIGDYSSTFIPNYVQPNMLDINGGATQSLPTQQPVYSQPAYEAPAYESPIYTSPNFVQPEMLDIYGGGMQAQPEYNIPAYEAPSYSPPSYEAPAYTPPSFMQPDMADIFSGMQSLPTQQPVYSAPAYEAPTYEAPVYSAPAYEAPASEAPAYVPFYNYEDVSTGGGGSREYGMRGYQELFARGGAVDMRDGAFVVDARTVSELGNGSSNAGMELLSRMGGKPVRGPGDGVSDSVPASIGGKQEARVARDEVIFQPEAVRRLGGGSEKRGTQKLYALMDKAHKARKKAKRGQDTGVRKGLA